MKILLLLDLVNDFDELLKLMWIYQTLSAPDMRDPSISALIASKMKEFHDLDMPGSKNVNLWDRLRYVIFEYRICLCNKMYAI